MSRVSLSPSALNPRQPADDRDALLLESRHRSNRGFLPFVRSQVGQHEQQRSVPRSAHAELRLVFLSRLEALGIDRVGNGSDPLLLTPGLRQRAPDMIYQEACAGD